MMFEYDKLLYDTMRCARRLMIESNGKLNQWIDNISDPVNEQSVIDVTRLVFNLPNWDNQLYDGVTDTQVLDLLDKFNGFVAKKD